MHKRGVQLLKKVRVDTLLVERGYFESRTQARNSILAGCVRIGLDRVVQKSNEKYEQDTLFTVSNPFPFVSRGALKLIPALDKHLPFLNGKLTLDVGASTGGFTQVLLNRGAKKVYAVDVGYGQLHYKLRNDPRVISLEKVNAKHLTANQIPDLIDVVTIDVSFISVKKILHALLKFLKSNTWIFLLVKPQFEVKAKQVDKGGVVRSVFARDSIQKIIISFVEEKIGWNYLETFPTDSDGLKKNIEYMMVFKARRR